MWGGKDGGSQRGRVEVRRTTTTKKSTKKRAEASAAIMRDMNN